MKKYNKKGFTLIEILAVIVILGILMVVTVPSVTDYILEARKDTYISTIKGYVDAVRNKVAIGDYSFNNKNTTYYVHIDNIELEKGGDNPYGEWVEAYVVVTYDPPEHQYYWVSLDSQGFVVELKRADEITKNDIKVAEERWISNTQGVGGRDKIYLMSSDGSVDPNLAPTVQLTQSNAKNCYKYEILDDTVSILKYDATCPKDVEVPSSIGGYPVTKIDSYAFNGLSLTSIKLPEGIVSIGSYAFRGNKLKDVKFPSTITKIDNGAFTNNLLTSISLPSGVTLGSAVFSNNEVPEEKAMIYAQAADGSSDYSKIIGYAGTSTSIIIPESIQNVPLKTIGAYSFYNLGLTNVVIPDTVEVIETWAFASNKFTTVDLPDNLKTIGSTAFAGNKLTTIDIPSSVTKIESRAFNNNKVADGTEFVYKRNTDGTIDYSEIVSYAGANKNVIIPSVANGVSLKTLSSLSFYSTGLLSVVIPSTVTTINSRAFNSNSLEEQYAFIYARKSDGSIDYTTLIGYGGANRGAVTPVEIPQSVNGVTLKTISTSAFSDTSLKAVIIPEGVTRISSSAFASNKLTEVTIPSTVTRIDSNAFKKSVNYNDITKIINKTGKEFNWKSITGSTYDATFVTGTIKHKYGNIEVVSK